MQAMIDELTQSISTRNAHSEKPGNFADADDRSAILEELKSELEKLRVSDIVGTKGVQGTQLGLGLAGGGLAAIGGIIALIFHAIYVPVIGQIIAGMGTVMVLAMLWKRAGVLRRLTDGLDRSCEEFSDRLNSEITDMFDRLFLRLTHALNESISRLDSVASKNGPLIEEAKNIIDEERRLD